MDGAMTARLVGLTCLQNGASRGRSWLLQESRPTSTNEAAQASFVRHPNGRSQKLNKINYRHRGDRIEDPSGQKGETVAVKMRGCCFHRLQRQSLSKHTVQSCERWEGDARDRSRTWNSHFRCPMLSALGTSLRPSVCVFDHGGHIRMPRPAPAGSRVRRPKNTRPTIAPYTKTPQMFDGTPPRGSVTRRINWGERLALEYSAEKLHHQPNWNGKNQGRQQGETTNVVRACDSSSHQEPGAAVVG